jgi:hypothetical protein
MQHGTRPVTLRTRWLTIGEGGNFFNSSSIYRTRPVKILWSMLPPLKLLNSMAEGHYQVLGLSERRTA